VTHTSESDHVETALDGRYSMQDNSKLRGYAKQYHNQISELLRRMPRELLLLLKANDCLRSIDVVLGRPLNTIAITARACSKAAVEADSIAARQGAINSISETTGEGTKNVTKPGRCATDHP
jgi:hypothetical protein